MSGLLPGLLLAVVLGATGLFFSAFFSGSETGFYRATRLRLLLDALAGDLVSRGLLWLSNHPPLFIATTLVGNNLANFVTSLAIVMGTQALVGPVPAAELAAPLLLVPVLFVCGELLPKDLFLQAPNRLLHRGGPLFLACVVMFFPVSMLLWGLIKVLERLVGESTEQIRLTLARRELRRALEEGHEAGILHPAQRALAQGIFAVARQPISHFTTPLLGLPRAHTDMPKRDVLRLAQRYQLAEVPVEAAQKAGELVGYLRVIDLELSEGDESLPLRPLLVVPATALHVATLMQLESAAENLAKVTNERDETIGIVTAARLREPLFGGGPSHRAPDDF